MARLTKHTIQGDDALQGDYSSSDLDIAAVNPNAYGISLFVVGTGNVSIKTLRGTTITYTNLAANTFVPTPLFTDVLSAGTTSADVIAYLVTKPFH